MFGFWFFVLLMVALLATLPYYPYSRTWGYAPSGVAMVLLITLLFLAWIDMVALAWPWAMT